MLGEPQRIRHLVVTRANDLDPSSVRCALCDRKLADIFEDRIEPSCEALIKDGAVAWPNFGWFCSVGCERDYGAPFNLSCAEREAKARPDNRSMQPRTLLKLTMIWSLVYLVIWVLCAAVVIPIYISYSGLAFKDGLNAIRTTPHLIPVLVILPLGITFLACLGPMHRLLKYASKCRRRGE